MIIKYINKKEFDLIKENLKVWLEEKVSLDPEHIFHFSHNLTDEDRKIIYKNSDNFIITKNKIQEIKDDFVMTKNKFDLEIDSKLENDKTSTETTTEQNSDKNINKENHEIVMRLGRKALYKIINYPQYNLGILYYMDKQINRQTTLIKGLICINLFMLLNFKY